MNNAIVYCLSLHNELLNKILQLNYVPVGLGVDNYSSKWLTDKSGKNISKKNPYYGEHTFHYWFWKNKLNNIDDNFWIGFCAYRRFWSNKNDKSIQSKINQKNFHKLVLNKIPKSWNNYDVILGDKIKVNNIKNIKILKYGKQALLDNPMAILKSRRNIKFQFDMFHGSGILDKAISVLNEEDKHDFNNFVNNENSFNQGNMFFCKSKKIMNSYYETIFNWLNSCEELFGFNLKGYGKKRIYAFLAERFMPYWFNKNAKVLEWPIIFYDMKKNSKL